MLDLPGSPLGLLQGRIVRLAAPQLPRANRSSRSGLACPWSRQARAGRVNPFGNGRSPFRFVLLQLADVSANNLHDPGMSR